MTDSKSNSRQSGNGFRISAGPVIRLAEDEHVHDFGDVVEPPRISGSPVLFAIARDPHTIFAYWDIDWRSVFGETSPMDATAAPATWAGIGSPTFKFQCRM